MSYRDRLYLIAALAILALPFVLGIMASVVRDSSPIPTPSISIPDYTLANCLASPPTPNIAMILSPDGRVCAIDDNHTILIIVDASGRQASWRWTKWLELIGWTADGRFAVFSPHDQYGNRTTHVFDTESWQTTSLFDGDYCFANTRSSCQSGVAALAPVSPRLLLADGQLHTLDNGRYHKLVAPTDLHYIPAAAWSPDESRLAYFASDDTYPAGDNQAVLWVGDGYGRKAISFDLVLTLYSTWDSTLTWTDNDTLTVTTPTKTVTFSLN